MGAAKDIQHELSRNSAADDLDQRFLKLLNELSIQAVDKASQCTGEIMEISQKFINQSASETLKKFYDLYFSSRLDESKENMNKEVDDMFDQIQENLAEGKDAGTGLDVSDEQEQVRLGLSGLQKQLEGLITLDEGLREKIIPALSSMQFEDAVRQRLQHIDTIWKKTFDELRENGPLDISAHANSLADLMTSLDETALFYRQVLKQEPPEGGMDAGDALLFCPMEEL